MSINSKDKGKRGERAWRDELREAGFVKSYRGQQYSGNPEAPDVICPELPSIHFEVKWVQRLNIWDAMEQAIRDSGEKTPVVAHTRNNYPWLVTLRANDYFDLIKESNISIVMFCPECKSTHIHRHGPYEKGGYRYKCANPECGKFFVAN